MSRLARAISESGVYHILFRGVNQQNLIRYIHQNPVKAGLVKKCEDYSYSSFMEYIEKEEMTNTERNKILV